MAKISNVRTDGRPHITTGSKQVNSYNLYPVNLVATASPGTILGIDKVDNFDFFPVAQSSASTDLIVLDTALPVGTEIWMYCVSACKVTNTSGDGVLINGGTDGQQVTLAAGSTYRFIKTSSTTVICNAFSAAGAITAPTPA